MTVDERKRAAATSLRRLLTEYGVIFKDGRRFAQLAERALEAGVPELFTEPPTHWVAPIRPPLGRTEDVFAYRNQGGPGV